jgi:hypothetical protein
MNPGGMMRTIRTFVIRLLVDTDEPSELRGTVRCIAGTEERPFADAASLLALLDCETADGRAEIENDAGQSTSC